MAYTPVGMQSALESGRTASCFRWRIARFNTRSTTSGVDWGARHPENERQILPALEHVSDRLPQR